MKQIFLASLLVVTLAACGGSNSDGGVVVGGGSGVGGSPDVSGGDSTSVSGGDSTGVSGGDSTGGNGVTDAIDNRDVTTTTSDPARELTASHRNGQTFLVWREVAGAEYHVYRHNSPINSGNLSAATRVTDRWGPLDQNTSVNTYGTDAAPRNFVISDNGQPLSEESGLFVHTTQDDQQGNAYYAVTSVIGGREDPTIVAGVNATTQPINEFVATPRPVLTVFTNGGKGRLYTQYMDYSMWNPTLSGYAFNFAVALPGNYNASRSYPLRVYLHAYGEPAKYIDQSEFDWPVIQLFPTDPGDNQNTVHTWWYGFARDHNYKTQGSVPGSGVVENFTEQRVMASIDFLLDDGQFNVDRELVHMYGHSMGGSGVLTYGMRYPSVIAGIYASEPMTNYSTNPIFQENFTRLWGSQSANLPIVNNGRNNSAISNYDSTGSQSTRVWNWMNHQEQLVRRRGDRFAYLMVDHGKDDRTIDWQTQGRPMASVFTAARVGFSAAAVGGVGHSWLAFDSVVHSVFGFGNGAQAGWLYPKSWSFPGIHNASGSGSLQPADSGDDRHNTNIEWSTANNNFHQGIADGSNRYEISLRSNSFNQTADITPRNTSNFRPGAGTQCSWTATSNSNNSRIGSGVSSVDGSRLLTIPAVTILTGSGTRLAISCP